MIGVQARHEAKSNLQVVSNNGHEVENSKSPHKSIRTFARLSPEGSTLTSLHPRRPQRICNYLWESDRLAMNRIPSSLTWRSACRRRTFDTSSSSE